MKTAFGTVIAMALFLIKPLRAEYLMPDWTALALALARLDAEVHTEQIARYERLDELNTATWLLAEAKKTSSSNVALRYQLRS